MEKVTALQDKLRDTVMLVALMSGLVCLSEVNLATLRYSIDQGIKINVFIAVIFALVSAGYGLYWHKLNNA